MVFANNVAKDEYRRKIADALEETAPYPALSAVATAMLKEHGRTWTYGFLDEVRQGLESKDDPHEDIVINVLDALSGWCADEDRL